MTHAPTYDWPRRLLLFCLLCSLLAGCGPSAEQQATLTSTAATATAAAWTPTPTLTATPTTTPTATPTWTPTLTATPTATQTPTPTHRPTATPTQVSAANSWDRYQPRTLKEIIAATQHEADAMINNAFFLNYGDNYPSQVEVTYTGQFREIPDVKMLLITPWLASFVSQLNAGQRDELFQREGLFIEDHVEYWLPVQSQLIPYMEDELKPGDPVTLLLVWVGLTKFSDEVEWIFLVNTFPY